MRLNGKKPRILFIDQSAELGGAELSLLDLARHVPGYTVVLLFESGPFQEELESAGIHVVVEPARGFVRSVKRMSSVSSMLHSLPSLLHLVVSLTRRARSFDILYANTQKAFVVAALAGLLARRPVIWHLRDILTARHFSRANRMVAVLLARIGSDRVIANSHATAKALLKAGGLPGQIRVVHNGVDTGLFDSVQPDEVDKLRQGLGLNGVPIVGVFSRLAPWKGQHILIEALPRLPKVHALLVGGALFGEEKYEADLRRLATERGVSSRVHFLGFRRDVAPLMKCCDVVSHTSVSPEPFGRVIIEAMAANRPVVATRAGGALEIITDRKTGLLVQPEDPEALVQAIQRILDDPDWGRQLATAARMHVRSTFSSLATAASVTQIIAEVLPFDFSQESTSAYEHQSDG